MLRATRNQLVWGALLALLVAALVAAMLWTTRYTVVTTGARTVVLYDRWTHKLCESDGVRTRCGVALP